MQVVVITRFPSFCCDVRKSEWPLIKEWLSQYKRPLQRWEITQKVKIFSVGPNQNQH